MMSVRKIAVQIVIGFAIGYAGWWGINAVYFGIVN
jgi:hypothetical protein